ncbi:TonB-dependent receptor domain-containing protein [uncultured Draconibacterium sp.]|uniref:TonB-dependent receptor n=1 Tax=uncultured Draconibacterium sp. TaxID=1573823 RepID=UPI003217BD5F
MKKALFSIVLLAVFSLFSLATIAQGTIKGVVVDAETSEALIGASVVLDGTTTGTVTDINGAFSLSVNAGDQKINISYIGYTTQKLNVKVSNGQTNDLGQVKLGPDAVGINEVMVLASVAVARKTPVAVSAIEPQQIAEKLGTQEYPEILKSTPGVYATRQGGGFGDSRINIRGFSQRNVAVMINGVPVNDMENGWVYWSNWAGLSEVTRSMQVQRGLGASKLSTGSIGGTMNIITKTTDAEKGGSVYSGIGNDGFKKTSFSLSTGLTENGWAISLSGAHTTGDGWVDGTQFEGWSYFGSISKRWTNQMLTLTAFGAPQVHGQRSSTQTIESVQQPDHGLRYNPEWGYKDGQIYNLRTNFYHKPQMSLNHYLTISDKATLATSAYYSFGTGGGTGNYGSNQNAFFNYTKEGQIDFDRIVEENIANGNGGSTAIIRNSRNDHSWMGVISNLQYDLGENFELSAGIDIRHYKGKHYREVEDLLGGDFVLSTEDKNNPDKIARKGDKIGYWNDGIVGWQGVFGQLEYSKNELSAFFAASFNNQSTKRVDYFNYLDSDPEQESDWQHHQAFVVKGGANYNINENHNVFGNIGYFEKTPIFDAIFINYVNDVNEGAANEKTLSFELGYGFRTHNFQANVNAYYTNWKDKFFRRSFYDSQGNQYSANIQGVNALHTGLEGDFKWKPFSNLTITGMASLGDWIWQNDLVDVPIVNDNQEEVGRVDLFIADLKVGDAAQTTFALGADYELFDGFKVGANWNYYDNLYAEFDPLGRGTSEKTQPWKVPAYGLVDANFTYYFTIGQFDAVLYANIINVFDTEFISDADDGAGHDWQSAKVYYGIGRTWSTGLKINF